MRHVCQHMEEIALVALPRGPEEMSDGSSDLEKNDPKFLGTDPSLMLPLQKRRGRRVMKEQGDLMRKRL